MNEIKKTDYKIKQIENSSWLEVIKDDKQEAQCIDEISCLHCIWVLEGSIYDYFYVVDIFGSVSCVDRGCL